MAQGNCSNCKNEEIAYFKEGSYENVYGGKKEPDSTFVKLNHSSDVLGYMYGKCNAGFNDVLKKFWNDNGKRPSKENMEIKLPCFEQHESDKMLDDIIGKTNEILELLKNR